MKTIIVNNPAIDSTLATLTKEELIEITED